MKTIALSELNPIRKIVFSKWFPEIIQVIFLLLFLGIIALGWGRYTPEGVSDKLYAKSNLVNLLIWGLWWPSMVITAVLLGRIWCSICPLELVSRFSEKAGRNLGIPQQNATRWMQAGWLILLFYGVVQMLIASIHLHRIPMYTSLYLFTLMILALMTGFFFRNRTFCSSLCPVGLLLKVYGRGGMLGVRPSKPGLEHDINITRSCKSLLNPLRLDQSRGDDCLMCLDCVQSDQEQHRMQFQLRMPWSNLDRRPIKANLPMTLFIMMVSGFVTYEISGFWPQVNELFLWMPSFVGQLMGVGAENGWLKGFWMIVIFPLLLWTILGYVIMAIKGYSSLIQAWRSMALPISLIIMAAHMTKAIEKLATWGGYLPYAIQDPTGVETAQGITDKLIASPVAIVGMPVILSVGTFLFIAALYLMHRETTLQVTKVRSEATTHSSVITPEADLEAEN